MISQSASGKSAGLVTANEKRLPPTWTNHKPSDGRSTAWSGFGEVLDTELALQLNLWDDFPFCSGLHTQQDAIFHTSLCLLL